MRATTLSVLLDGSKSIMLGVKHEDEYVNLTLRFDKGEAALICGFPMEWGIHNITVDYYDHDSPMGLDFEHMHEEDRPFKVYVSADDEIKILRAGIRGIERQAKDPMFRDSATTKFRQECIMKIRKAILELENPNQVCYFRKGA